jgi:hypothetical protein
VEVLGGRLVVEVEQGLADPHGDRRLGGVAVLHGHGGVLRPDQPHGGQHGLLAGMPHR